MKPSAFVLMKKIGKSTYFINLIFRFLFLYNRNLNFMLHFSSRVRAAKKVKIIENDSFNIYRCLAESNSVYIQGLNGIVFHSCLQLAPGVKIISANHCISNLDSHSYSQPIMIGKNVWIGANAILLPGVVIGDNAVIGAGSVVTKSIPANSIAVGNPCRVIKNVCIEHN